MSTARHPLLITLFSSTGIEGASYSKISVNRARELLDKIHDIIIGRRWTFKLETDFVNQGLIKRTPRTDRQNDGTIRRFSSLIKFTTKGLKHLWKMGILKAKIAWQKRIAYEREQSLKKPSRDKYIKLRNKQMDEQERRLSENPTIDIEDDYD